MKVLKSPFADDSHTTNNIQKYLTYLGVNGLDMYSASIQDNEQRIFPVYIKPSEMPELEKLNEKELKNKLIEKVLF